MLTPHSAIGAGETQTGVAQCFVDSKLVRDSEAQVANRGRSGLGLMEDPVPFLKGIQPRLTVSVVFPHLGLRLFFDYFTNIVPFASWNPLMRLLGLNDNDIYVARAQVWNPRDALYEMLVTWLSHKGRAASVNTLLDALETLGERHAKELIQDHLVGSGKYVYEEGGAGSAPS